MSHPFQVGDVVYHAVEGESLISEVKGNDIFLDNLGDYVPAQILSFSPWPAPNHVRSRRPGWWLVQNAAESSAESGWPYIVILHPSGDVEGEGEYIRTPLIFLGRIPDGVVHEEIPEEMEETNAPEWAVKD